MKKVVLGLSDGVDSAVSAYILQKRGFDVYGLYMDISGEQGREAAKRSAAQTGIPLRILDVRDTLMSNVCLPFIDDYINGRTPNPCIVCNRKVKLPVLEEYANEIRAEFIATGHYVRTDGHCLYMGSADNDQSYMFQRLTQSQVDRLLLPLGEKNKAEVRKLAGKLGLSCAQKADSRDNCFIKGMNCADWIEENVPERIPKAGDVVLEGRVIARHEGIHHFTPGQRWGEDENGRRLYVAGIDAASAVITLGFWEDIFSTSFTIRDMSWISGETPMEEFDGFIRARHTRRETPACHISFRDGKGYVTTQTAVRAPAPGQPAAIYSGNRLLGGGFVCKD